MSEQTAPAPAPAASGNGLTNLILIVGIGVISWSILKAGEAREESALPEITVLGDDFWMSLPENIKKLRDELAAENRILNAKIDSVADKQKQANETEDEELAGKLNDEIETVVSEQEAKVKTLQKEYFRRLNVLRQGYIARKESELADK